jgi:hypothetical protein
MEVGKMTKQSNAWETYTKLYRLHRSSSACVGAEALWNAFLAAYEADVREGNPISQEMREHAEYCRKMLHLKAN